jgi:hypothetical protein
MSDLLFRVHLIDAHSEVLGPFEPPPDPEARDAFVQTLRETLAGKLEQHRATARLA